MATGIFFLFAIFVFSVTASPARAGKYISGAPARKMLAEDYSVHFEKFSRRVTCFRKITAYVKNGRKSICWSVDMRKIKAMHITVSLVKESVSDETLQGRVFSRIFKVPAKTLSLKLLGEQALSSGMKVSHYRVSGEKTDYEPYISVLKFLVNGNRFLVAFFNGKIEDVVVFANGKKEVIGGGGVPIQDDVMKFIGEGKIAPIR